jgi:hypothetical protein
VSIPHAPFELTLFGRDGRVQVRQYESLPTARCGAVRQAGAVPRLHAVGRDPLHDAPRTAVAAEARRTAADEPEPRRRGAAVEEPAGPTHCASAGSDTVRDEGARIQVAISQSFRYFALTLDRTASCRRLAPMVCPLSAGLLRAKRRRQRQVISRA